MSRTDHHRRVRRLHAGNPARLLVDDRAAVRKGILKSSGRDKNGYPFYSSSVTLWAKPGIRKAFQTAAHRRDRQVVRAALATAAYQHDPARRQAIRLERVRTPVARRSVNQDMA